MFKRTIQIFKNLSLIVVRWRTLGVFFIFSQFTYHPLSTVLQSSTSFLIIGLSKYSIGILSTQAPRHFTLIRVAMISSTYLSCVSFPIDSPPNETKMFFEYVLAAHHLCNRFALPRSF